ncbi:RDD family protein [Paenibacillus thiaminolyticus]|uniref:RDD family protein n=1 Tax=Paenibacillus thiaminolyticus TaxID=49283 RepID=UPI0021759D43|nr:RDD family protein [Paenibacillus thiaminolyticus]
MGSSQLDVDLTRRPVGFFRRVIALLLDHLCIGFIHWIIAMLVVNGNDLVQYSGWPAKALIFYTTLAHIFFFMPITITVYFMLIPMWTGGKTFGKWVMRIHLIDDRLAADPEGPKKLSFKGLLIRYGLLYFGIGGINHLFFYTIIFGGMTLVEPFGSIIIMLWFVFNAFVVLHVLLHISRGDKRLFYEKLSGTRNVIRSRT